MSEKPKITEILRLTKDYSKKSLVRIFLFLFGAPTSIYLLGTKSPTILKDALSTFGINYTPPLIIAIFSIIGLIYAIVLTINFIKGFTQVNEKRTNISKVDSFYRDAILITSGQFAGINDLKRDKNKNIVKENVLSQLMELCEALKELYSKRLPKGKNDFKVGVSIMVFKKTSKNSNVDFKTEIEPFVRDKVTYKTHVSLKSNLRK